MPHHCPYCLIPLPTAAQRIAHLADPHACSARQTPSRRLDEAGAARRRAARTPAAV